MFVDSHCHLDKLDLTPYSGDLNKAISAATAQKVSHMLCVNIDLEHFDDVLGVACAYENIFASVGVHPMYQESRDPTENDLIELAQHEKIVAIGETGLDYFYCKGDLAWQRERFRTHIRAANKLNKPIIVHTRGAKADTLAIMREESASNCRGVLHCFTEDLDMAKQAIDLGFCISISGIATFNNAAELRDVIKVLPLSSLLIETDSPYLAPVPYRGKSNEPCYVPEVAKCISKIKGIGLEEVAAVTTENFFNLFKQARRYSDAI